MLVAFVLFNITILIIIKLYSKLSSGICKCSQHMVGKVVVVTGANTGIGYETAKDVAARGAKVILACRNESLAVAACNKIQKETNNKDVHYKHLDLSSLKSVREFAKYILDTENRLDVLINNAGAYTLGKRKTEDGLLIGMQTNHFGPFLLTNLILPLLKKSAPSRIINVSSQLYMRAKLNLEDLNLNNISNRAFSDHQVYCNSKLCNVLMSNELSRRLKGTHVTVNSLYPGVVKTEIMRDNSGFVAWIDRIIFKLFAKNPWEGAQTQIYLAVSPEVETVSGRLFADCKLKAMSTTAQDQELAKKLWEKSEQFVGLK